jgi:site-specific DNA recombinase
MTRYVGLVCRISKAPNGRTEGVKAQEKWGRHYAGSAWPDLPIEVFADNNISAANGDNRPEFERFREWVAAGKVAHVWAVEQSRLERREVEWFRLAAELDAAGITEVHTNRDGIVRVRDEVAGIKAVLNAGETRKLKKRVNDRLAEIAAAGRPSGGTVFGYRRALDAGGAKTLVIVPEQAEAIRWAADKILSGWSLSNIAASLRKRGFRGALGGKIGVSAVRSAVCSPTVSGHRVYQGRIVGKGVWEPILDEQTRQAVKAKLDGDRVVRRKDGGAYPVGAPHRGQAHGRRYLLTGGLAVCGACKARLIGAEKQLRKGVKRPYLLCHPVKGGKGCVGVPLVEAEVFVVDKLFDELDKPEFLEAIAADNHAEQRDAIAAALGEVERKRNELADMWNLPQGHPEALTTDEWKTARRRQAEQEQALRADLAAVPPPVVDVDIAAARSAWPGMTLDEQREFLRLFVERVTINPVGRGYRGVDDNRVKIEWRKL